jgi:hypothetical protein
MNKINRLIAVASYFPALVLLFSPYIGLQPKPGMRWVQIVCALGIIGFVGMIHYHSKLFRRK